MVRRTVSAPRQTPKPSAPPPTLVCAVRAVAAHIADRFLFAVRRAQNGRLSHLVVCGTGGPSRPWAGRNQTWLLGRAFVA
eukprot:5680886-Lingulodinium_polyedra.AAC.1